MLDPGAAMRLPDRPRRCFPRPGCVAAGRNRALTRAVPARAICRLGPADHARVRQFAPLAYRLAWWFARERARDMPVDDLIAEALYGLTYAAGRYDEARRVPFGAYALVMIRHRLRNGVRAWRRGRWIPPLSAVTDRDDETWEAIADRRSAPDPQAGAAARELCERIRRVLPARWYNVLHWYHAEGRSLLEIGRRLGVSPERVRQILIKAADRARELFAEGLDEE